MAKHSKAKKRTGGKRKTLIIVLVSVVAAAAAAAGVIAALRARGGEAAVYPAEDFITSADWATNAQADGLVSTDKLQSVYVSSTQQITEIYVQEGQEVKTGDPILAFDTTLSEISLQRQAIKVDQLKLDIQDAQAELAEIGTYKIGSPSVYVPSVNESAGPAASGGSGPVVAVPFERTDGGLGTRADPLIYIWDDGCVLDESFIRQAVALASENREKALERLTPAETEEPVEPTEPTETEEPTDPPSETGEPTDPPTETEEPTEPPTETTEPVEPSETGEPADNTGETGGDGTDEAAEAAGGLMNALGARLSPAEEPVTLPAGIDDPHVYAVFETREENTLNGGILRAWELELLLGEDGSWSVRLLEPDYDPGNVSGDSAYDDGGWDDFYYDDTVYYTASEIAQMKAQCNQRIRDLQLELKTAELEYERLEYELSNGEIYSKIDGVVKTVRDVDEARSENLPVVLVSGGGGYYVTAVLGELELDTMAVGDPVSVNSWETGEQREGVITEISEYPDDSGQYWYSSGGNQNVSTYPFKVFVDEDANLREGSYVTVSYTAAGAGADGLFLDNTFIRQENGKSYIYAPGADGTLEKRFVKTGRNLWGSYTEITEGLAEDEYIAFPYGRDVKDGARIRYAESEELYSAYY